MQTMNHLTPTKPTIDLALAMREDNRLPPLSCWSGDGPADSPESLAYSTKGNAPFGKNTAQESQLADALGDENISRGPADGDHADARRRPLGAVPNELGMDTKLFDSRVDETSGENPQSNAGASSDDKSLVEDHTASAVAAAAAAPPPLLLPADGGAMRGADGGQDNPGELVAASRPPDASRGAAPAQNRAAAAAAATQENGGSSPDQPATGRSSSGIPQASSSSSLWDERQQSSSAGDDDGYFDIASSKIFACYDASTQSFPKAPHESDDNLLSGMIDFYDTAEAGGGTDDDDDDEYYFHHSRSRGGNGNGGGGMTLPSKDDRSTADDTEHTDDLYIETAAPSAPLPLDAMTATPPALPTFYKERLDVNDAEAHQVTLIDI